jgi:leucyl aminopeptidase
MRWNGKAAPKKKTKSTAPALSDTIAFVGKGVTFDTGGLNIKPSAGLEDMKIDMGGAAAVVGLLKVLALRKAKANVVGIVGLAENAISGNAYRPSDIITSLSGKTVEILNTDAEGRLVLADSLTYVQRTDKPSVIIDLATLTGAMLVALGHEYCGTFVNDDGLWSKMEAASRISGEKLWRMPLDDAFSKEMKGEITDYRNLGAGRNAGACTAAAFLEFFIEKGVKWAHMDIAGMTMNKKDKHARNCFGVRVLDELVARDFE